MSLEAAVAAPLPYGPIIARLLRPLQRGFLVLNRGFMAPMFQAGLGWMIGNPITGHVLLLRTHGRRSGARREAPVGYVIRNGSVYVVAGYGAGTPWYLNLVANPDVEVLLPTRRFRGTATPVTEPGEWLGAYRALIASFGMLGRAVVGDVHCLDDATLLAEHRALPIVRIEPVEGVELVVSGRFDPGGRGWVLPWAGTAALVGLWIVRVGRRGAVRRRRRAGVLTPDGRPRSGDLRD
ncbi:MAG: nitroreductase family deazaflavin-dependent oxidoreductase [Chloroflexi bacterium]|nr:nitroreductase family deazaflavin-dependent oxidoreductase [Chloroflexota bacterium]